MIGYPHPAAVERAAECAVGRVCSTLPDIDPRPHEAQGRKRKPEAVVQRLSMALCPACETLNAPEDRNCRACGAPLVMRCPACETINVRARSHCHRCQAPLHTDAATEPPVAGSAARETGAAAAGMPDTGSLPELQIELPAGEEGDTAPMPYRVGSLQQDDAAGQDMDIPELTLDGSGAHREDADRTWILPLRDAELPASRLAALRQHIAGAPAAAAPAPAPARPAPPDMPAASKPMPSRRKRDDAPDWPTLGDPQPAAPATALPSLDAAREPEPPSVSATGSKSAAAIPASRLASMLPAAAREALGPAGLAALDPAALAALQSRAPDHQRAKAERRAKVRQRQLQTQRRTLARAVDAPTDVLVLEPLVESRATICMVLEAFGFHPRIAGSAAEMLKNATRRRYAAVMLGIGTQRQEAPALCQQLLALPGLARTPVFAIGDARHHADRVRMQLAGAVETLLRPVDRGALARCLQAHGIALPRDPRLGGPPTV